MDTKSGVGEITAQDIVAEIGCDMNQFPSASHLVSWAGIAPGNNESAGRKTGKTKDGNFRLKSCLIQAA